MKNTISEETRSQAMKIAKATQKPRQTKEQTKLIAQGIEKGIAEYKKQQKAKAREKDKIRKQELKAKSLTSEQPEADENQMTPAKCSSNLPWILLVLSWAGFVAMYFI